MNYIFSTIKNNFDLVKYENDISPDYRLFLKGKDLGKLDSPLIYTIPKKSNLKKINSLHILTSSGAHLISNQLREVIESVASDDVEFYDATIMFENEKIEGFSAMNLKYKTDCIDLSKSEYKLDSFDPSEPDYRFYYMVVADEDLHVNIVRCKEFEVKVVVSEKVKDACKKANLKGLVFYQTLDMTYNNRTISETI